MWLSPASLEIVFPPNSVEYGIEDEGKSSSLSVAILESVMVRDTYLGFVERSELNQNLEGQNMRLPRSEKADFNRIHFADLL
jgi:hypothetical protein